MGEGVDPTEMCQSLVHKVQRSRQLLAQADPEIVLLFEEWLEALEEEAARLAQAEPGLEAQGLAAKLGISPKSARFLLERLKAGEQD
jgi:hypothetical protein